MNDRDKWREFLNSQDVEYTLENGDIKMSQGDNKVEGYTFFFVLVEFDEFGYLKQIGAWE